VQTENLIDQFELAMPLAVEWASEQEQRILHEGEPLSDSELADAKAVGVRDPERRMELLILASIFCSG
jgi:hypothetical protein